MDKEKELDMNELIESFGDCSTDYTKTACTYYANYLEEYQKEKIRLEQENQQLHNKIDRAIEYINGAWEMGCYTKTVALYSEELEELLEILKDSDVYECK